jgi:hypothetical protein
MNATEAAYAQRLRRLKLEGKIHGYRFEWEYIDLSDDCTYTPDFDVIRNDGCIEYHEVKAMWTGRKVGWREDAKIKFKWARNSRTNVFVLAARHKDGTWHLEEYNGQSATITPEERKVKRSGMHALVAKGGASCATTSTRMRKRSACP